MEKFKELWLYLFQIVVFSFLPFVGSQWKFTIWVSGIVVGMKIVDVIRILARKENL